MLVLDEDAKVSTVTSLSDLRIKEVKGQRKVKLTNMCQMTKVKRVNVLVLGQRCKSDHGDLFARPTVKGSKVKERSNYKKCQMTKVTVSICWCWANMHNCHKGVKVETSNLKL